MSILPSQTDEGIPRDDDKEGPVWWQVRQVEDSGLAVMKAGHASFGPQLPKYQMQILTLWLPMMDARKWLWAARSSSHLEMGPYFHKTNSDPLISNSGHLLFTS